MANILIIGATRGLGLELAKQYQSRGDTVCGTARASSPKDPTAGIKWVPDVDLAQESAAANLIKGLPRTPLDTVIFTAGYFGKETFDDPSFDKEVLMYKTSAIGPVLIVHALVKEGLVKKGGKVIIVSSESGSIALRHESEGGGNFGHHGSKAASNMVGKLLSLDLREKEIAVCNVHPGFMRTEMTKSVGFDQFWDDGGGEYLYNEPCSKDEKLTLIPAVTPDVAAKSLLEFVDTVDMSKTGQYWAPRGPGYVLPELSNIITN